MAIHIYRYHQPPYQFHWKLTIVIFQPELITRLCKVIDSAVELQDYPNKDDSNISNVSEVSANEKSLLTPTLKGVKNIR